MFELIGYWLSTTILVTPLWVVSFIGTYIYLDDVYYQVPDNHTHLPFYNKVNDLLENEYLFWSGLLLGIISLLFTVFSGLIGVKVGMGFVGGVINSAHAISTFFSTPMSWLVSVSIGLFAMRTVVQFFAKFAVMRKKIDQLGK